MIPESIRSDNRVSQSFENRRRYKQSELNRPASGRCRLPIARIRLPEFRVRGPRRRKLSQHGRRLKRRRSFRCWRLSGLECAVVFTFCRGVVECLFHQAGMDNRRHVARLRRWIGLLNGNHAAKGVFRSFASQSVSSTIRLDGLGIDCTSNVIDGDLGPAKRKVSEQDGQNTLQSCQWRKLRSVLRQTCHDLLKSAVFNGNAGFSSRLLDPIIERDGRTP